MLQARLFSYGDAQRCRLGINHRLIPANAPRCPVHSYHCDGAMRVDGNFGGTLGYEPNSYGEWQEQPEFREPPLSIEGAADHWNHREDTDYYSQRAEHGADVEKKATGAIVKPFTIFSYHHHSPSRDEANMCKEPDSLRITISSLPGKLVLNRTGVIEACPKRAQDKNRTCESS
jgi:catalase